MAEQATFLYYAGRMALFDQDWAKASDSLQSAFTICQCYDGSNEHMIKKQILKYLVPVKIVCGYLPEVELLHRYELFEYVDMVEAIFLGDLKRFKIQVNTYKKLWIKRGLFLMMEQLEIILIRNLFKKTFELLRKGLKTVQLDTNYFMQALNWNTYNKEVFEIDEVECILANLIFNGYIKGYISHEKRKIVFSKENQFPSLKKFESNK